MRLTTMLLLGSALSVTRAVGQIPAGSQHHAMIVPSTGEIGQLTGTSTSPFVFRSSASHRLDMGWDTVVAKPRHKSPFLAWFLSWLVPGGGQGYNGQWGKAAAFFVPAAAGFAVVAASDGFSCTEDCGTRDVGLVIMVAASVGSQIEAPIAASKINREARKARGTQVSLTMARVRF